METAIGPAFRELGYEFRGEGHGSVQNANLVLDRQRFPDIFISAGTPPTTILMETQPPLATWYVAFASDEMVIAYSANSPFAPQFAQVQQGRIPWYAVLSNPEVRFLRTDPDLDPKGYYAIITVQLASLYYNNGSLSELILRGDRNPAQLRPEEILVTLLETGEADAIPAYRHEAVERGQAFVALPSEINLGSPAQATFYQRASFTLTNGRTVVGAPIVFVVTIPTTVRNEAGAMAFVRFLLSDRVQALLAEHGFGQIPFQAGGNLADIPRPILPLLTPAA
jgi:molybdate/tungstate transport system substrate-binding protein